MLGLLQTVGIIYDIILNDGIEFFLWSHFSKAQKLLGPAEAFYVNLYPKTEKCM